MVVAEELEEVMRIAWVSPSLGTLQNRLSSAVSGMLSHRPT